MRILYSILLSLPWLCLSAQDTFDSGHKYFERFPSEKIFTHLSRTDLLAGENLHFKVYLVSARNLPQQMSKVVYVELLDARGVAVQQSRISLQTYSGDGFMSIPATLGSGVYTFRAYTRWMRNFSTELFYTCPVRIVNTFKRLPVDSLSPTGEISVKLFPEGGQMLSNTTCRVGVESMKDGQGLSVSAILETSDGQKIKDLKTNHQGLGSFEFIPEAGLSYVVRYDSTKSISLPKANDNGYSILVNQIEDGYQVKISSTEEYGYLALNSADSFYYSEKIDMSIGTYQKHLTQDELKVGVNQLTVFDYRGFPVLERLLFRHPEKSLEIKTSTDDTTYSVRENLNVELLLSNEDVSKASLSISVYRFDSLFDWNHQNIEAELLLTSELSGWIENPGYYLSDAVLNTELDDLLIVRGWRRYDWEQIRKKADKPIPFLPEFRLPVATGKISMDGKGVRDATVYLSRPDSVASTLIGRTGEDGLFLVEMPGGLTSSSLYVETDAIYDDIQLLSPFETEFRSAILPYLEIERELEPFLTSLSEQIQVTNAFEPREASDKFEAQSFYGTPDASYILDDFTRFPVMEEVIREYVYGVYPRKNEGSWYFKVLDLPQNLIMKGEPLILLDGVPVFDTDKLMNLDPLQIKKIDVIKRRYGYGAQVADGIVSFFSFKGDMAGYELPPSTLQFNYENVQVNKKFYSPDHSIPSSRIPDFRNQLFWEANLSVSSGETTSVNFFTSDVPGTYRVVIHGISDEGMAGTSGMFFVVE